MLSVHVEVLPHLHRTVQAIKALGAKAGVVLNPSTPVTALEQIAGDVDFVLVMSVDPGFGGQTFIPQSLDKLRRRLCDELVLVGEVLGREDFIRASGFNQETSALDARTRRGSCCAHDFLSASKRAAMIPDVLTNSPSGDRSNARVIA